MTDRKLTRVPLLEYLFEVRWAGNEGVKVYDEFELSLGRLYERLRERFPVTQRINSLPRELYDAIPPVKNVPFIRFLPTPQNDTSELSYPLIQYGPGIATCNVDRASYDWAQFAQQSSQLFGTLKDCHDSLEARIDTILLRSLDAFELSESELNKFLSEKMTIEISSGVDALPALQGAIKLPEFSTTWRLSDDTTLRVAAFNGAAGDKQGLIVDIAVQSGRAALQTMGDIESLLKHQHKLAGDSFFGLLQEDFINELRDGKN
jgi:uncharacterized protein (TIGR04255 family)